MANLKPLQVTPVDDFVLRGVSDRLFEVFGVRPVMTNSTDHVQSLKKLREGAAVTYPFLVCVNTNIQLSEDRWKATTLMRRGILLSLHSDNAVGIGAKVTPCDFTFQLDYYTNKFEQVHTFGERFLIAHLAGQLKFNIEYGVTVLEVGITPDSSVSLPTREADPTTPGEYKTTVNMVVHGFTSDGTVEVQLAKEVSIDGYVDSTDQPLTPAVTRQFMSFNRKWN